MKIRTKRNDKQKTNKNLQDEYKNSETIKIK